MLALKVLNLSEAVEDFFNTAWYMTSMFGVASS